MNIQGRCGQCVTGAGSGIGQAVAVELAERGHQGGRPGRPLGERAQGGADRSTTGWRRPLAEAMIGDVTDADFRRKTFDLMCSQVRAAGRLRPRRGHHSRPARRQGGQADRQGVDLPDRELPAGAWRSTSWPRSTGRSRWSPGSPRSGWRKGKGRWAAGEGIQGTVIFIGSISSSGIPGQVSYSATKAALEGVAATLGKEAIYHGVRFATIHPGFTDTPMVRALGAGVHREEHPPLHPAQAADRPGRDRRRDLLHDLQLGGQRRALGRRRLAPAGVK